MVSFGGASTENPQGHALAAAGPRGEFVPVASPKDVALPIEINIAYGTEKQQWLEAATAEFGKQAAGQGITVNLHGMGSGDGARAVVAGPSPVPIQVWSPASSAYRDHFEREWRAAHDKPPIQKAENLALTPMVFVMWESRRSAFLKKYQNVSFQTLALAIKEPGGWGAIAGQAEWGRFKFGHTHPGRSNSGLLTLVLMAYEYFQLEHNLTSDECRPAGLSGVAACVRARRGPPGRLAHAQHRHLDA